MNKIKRISIKMYAALFCASIFSFMVDARKADMEPMHYSDHEESRGDYMSCKRECGSCDLCDDILSPCRFSVQANAGVLPIVWLDRHDEALAAELPSYFGVYQVPFIVGGKIGYNLTSCIEVYGEVEYARAKGKSCISFNVNCSGVTGGSATIATNLSPYSAVGAWAGARYYFGFDRVDRWFCWCKKTSFFAGLQVGFVHHDQVDVTIASTSAQGNSGPMVSPLLLKTNSVSAGGNFGFDVAINDCFSFVFTFELLANGATKNYPVICLCNPVPGINSSTALVGRFGTELWLPVLFGFKYTF